MKNVLIAAGLVVIIVFTTVISLTMFGHNTRQNEVEAALTSAVEQTLSNLMVEKHYSINNTHEFIADFTQRLVLGLDSDSEVTINILAMDMEKGLLDVEVVETYRQMDGSTGSASYRKTVILDEVPAEENGEEAPLGPCSITFMVESVAAPGSYEIYKMFTIPAGHNVIFPGKAPEKTDSTFVGWSLAADSAEIVTSTMQASENMIFYAVFIPNS